MQLIKFLMIGTILSIVLGEFGQYPFGTTTLSVSLTDVLLSLTVGFFLVWQIGIKRTIAFPPIFIGAALFWLVGFVSLVTSGNLSGGLYLIRFVLYNSSFLISYFLIKNDKDNLKYLINSFLITGILVSLLGIVQLFIFPDVGILADFGYDPHKNRLVSTFLDPNFVGSFLNIILMVTLGIYYLSKRKVWFVVFGLMFASVILTFSRSALVMLLLEMVLFGLIMQRKLLIILMVTFVLLYFFVPRINERISGAVNLDVTARDRLESWNKGLEIFYDKPILGVGFDNIRDAYKQKNLIKVFSENGGNAGAGSDSSIIFILATTGLIGFAVYFGWFFRVILDLIKFHHAKAWIINFISLCFILGLFLNSQFINSMFFPPIMLTYYSILGGVYALNEQKK